MANAVLTRTCDKRCSFCFAPNLAPSASSKVPEGSLSLGELGALATRLRQDGKRTVPLVGGEPTLHPEFREAVLLILGLGMTVRLFTHGHLSDDVLEFLEGLPVAACLSVVNASASLSQTGRLPARVLRTLARLGPRACLGVTIADALLPYERLIPLYDEHQLAPRFRLGLSQPTLEAKNGAVLDYRDPALGECLTRLVLGLSGHGIEAEFDCGFVMCTFTHEQHALLREAGVRLRSVCGTIPDVGAEGAAWPCYPLSSSYQESFDEGASLADIRARFDGKLRGFRALGLYEECATCSFFADGTCTGGCVARIIPKFVQLGRRPADGAAAT